MTEKHIEIRFPPKLEFLFRPKRYKIMRGGRGSGKSWGVARALIVLATMGCERILCTREVQESIKESVHQLLKDQIEAMGYGGFFEILANEIRGANGSRFLFAGLSDLTAESIKSYEGVTIVWVEEGKNVTKRSWDILVPTIRASRWDGTSSEIWCTYNPELETDETHKRFAISPPEDCISIELNYLDNPWFPLVLEKERLHCQKYDPDNYDNIWEGKCKPAVEGAIYYRELQMMQDHGRYRDVPYDPMLLVHTFWDLGNSNNMRITLAQRVASEVRIIGHVGGGLDNLAQYVAELESKKYRYGTDFLPHDARARRMTETSNKTTEQMLKDLGRTVIVLPAFGIEDGIRAVQMMLPRTFIDKTLCVPLFDSLRRYKRHVSKDGVVGGPVHDDASHDADTVRYLAMAEERMYNSGELGNNDSTMQDDSWIT
jgi:phage terminase large subunit